MAISSFKLARCLDSSATSHGDMEIDSPGLLSSDFSMSTGAAARVASLLARLVARVAGVACFCDLGLRLAISPSYGLKNLTLLNAMLFICVKFSYFE